MAGRVNHRGWIVLESVASTDGSLCVDFFEDPLGGFGFEHLRADPEDGGRWTAIGNLAGGRHSTVNDAVDAAVGAVGWLLSEPKATEQISAFRARISDGQDPTDRA